MCEPTTALAVMAVATAAAGTVSQIQSAKAQTKAIENQHRVAAEENRVQASTEMFDSMRATRREQSRIRAAAGEAGLNLDSGSIEGLLLDSAMQGELQRSRSIANMESRAASLGAEVESMMSQIQKPTALGAGLQIGSAALSGWAGMSQARLDKAKLAEGA